MPQNKLEIAQTSQNTWGVIDTASGMKMGEFMYSHHATLLENADFAKDIVTAFTKYIRQIHSRMGTGLR